MTAAEAPVSLQVLALEPYHGGSHAAFLDAWRRRSRHRWTVETLPASHWKWRMRGAAVTLADRVARRSGDGEGWDVLLVTDMLDLAAFRGLAPPSAARLPAVVYFHENQLTYPLAEGVERDLHPVFTNLTTALAAREAWFNSAYHREEWLAALPGFLARLPDHRPRRAVERIAARSRVEPPGVAAPRVERPAERQPGPMRLLWAARWEHDKGPELLCAALERTAERGVDFRLSVLGQAFRQVPEVFARMRRRFADRLDHWGYLESRREYGAALAAADVVVSTARHEYFGLAVVEAVAAGCRPLVPRALAYPEVLGGAAAPAGWFHDGTADGLAARLEELSRQGPPWPGDPSVADPYLWRYRVPALDAGLERAARG